VTLDESYCSDCGALLDKGARFCSACGIRLSGPGNAEKLSAPLADREASTGVNGSNGKPPASTRLTRLVWIIALGLVLVMLRLVMFDDDPLRSFFSNLTFGSPPNLSIEVTKSPAQGPAAKFGYIAITNLGSETVTLKNVSVNHRKDAACSFGADATPFGVSPALQPGHNIMLGTVGLLLGACGSVLVISTTTDKGTADYTIEWR
jgi:hypothetical protein